MHVDLHTIRHRASRLVAAVVLALGAACATASGGTAGAGQDDPPAARDVLDAAGLEGSAASNLYDAIQQLRPEMLSGHHLGVPDVYIGAVKQSAGLDRLKQLTVGTVAEVRYLPYAKARALPGEQSEAGALVVTLR